MSRWTTETSASAGRPRNPSRSATAPALMTPPATIAGSSACWLITAPGSRTVAARAASISASSAPRSRRRQVKTRTPASYSAARSASRSPARPAVIAADVRISHGTPAARASTSLTMSGVSIGGVGVGHDHAGRHAAHRCTCCTGRHVLAVGGARRTEVDLDVDKSGHDPRIRRIQRSPRRRGLPGRHYRSDVASLNDHIDRMQRLRPRIRAGAISRPPVITSSVSHLPHPKQPVADGGRSVDHASCSTAHRIGEGDRPVRFGHDSCRCCSACQRFHLGSVSVPATRRTATCACRASSGRNGSTSCVL